MRTRKNDKRRTVVNILATAFLAIFFWLGIMGYWSDESPARALDAKTTLALETLNKLYTLPDPDLKDTPANVKLLMKKKVAEHMILNFAGQLKTGKSDFSTTISPTERADALKLLDGSLWLFADERFGNKNQKADIEEWDKLQAEIKNNVGLLVLNEMCLTFMR